MSIGHKSIPYAAKAMSFTMIDLFENTKLIDAMKKEFKERKGDYIYKAILPDGPPPVPVTAGGE
jgi:aminobenzoyl-glutamate utilization protein B